MEYGRLALLGVMLMSAKPYSCHKPTTSEEYADGKRCFAAFDANLQLVSSDQMKSAGVDRYAVELAAQETASGVFDSGERLRVAPSTINAELNGASLAYRRTHSWHPNGASRRKFSAFGHNFNECLADFYGRPND